MARKRWEDMTSAEKRAHMASPQGQRELAFKRKNLPDLAPVGRGQSEVDKRFGNVKVDPKDLPELLKPKPKLGTKPYKAKGGPKIAPEAIERRVKRKRLR